MLHRSQVLPDPMANRVRRQGRLLHRLFCLRRRKVLAVVTFLIHELSIKYWLLEHEWQPCSVSFRCIPEAWVNDDWPDCFDGSDEEEDGAAGGKTLPQQLVCIQVRVDAWAMKYHCNVSLFTQCAGVVLSAGFVCRETSSLTNDCLEEVMGKGGACNQCVDMYLNLP